MKEHPIQTKNARHARKLGLLVALLIAALAMTGCYVEPDRIVDDTNGLTVATGGQQFQTVITPVPTATASPTPAPSGGSQQLDWSSWDFNNDNATNPPSNVITVGPAGTAGTSGGATVAAATATPKPTATSTTGTGSSTTLKSGSSGTAVKQLQTRLKELGYYSGSLDGDYGAGTVAAVKAFQAANNLTADGVAGTKTQEAAYGYYAVPKSKSSTSSSSSGSSGSSGGSKTTTTTTTTTTNSYTNGKTNIYLQMGSSGAQVKILQNRLIVLGYLAGTADGTFAETTEAAVVAFQKRNSIYADGVAGPTTLTKLYSSSAKKASSVAAYLGSLKLGMNGNGVRALQSRLKDLGYYTGSVDGDYGAATQAAVISFQSDNGLTKDGVAGKSTMNALYSSTGTGGSGTSGGSSSGGTDPASYGETASTNGYKTISSTTKSSVANVTALQSVLSSTGYYSGTLDGDYGSGTIAAVKSFQAAKGLRVTGVAGPSTQRLLYGGTSASGSYKKLSKTENTGASSDIKKLQYTLYELMYYDGKITGKFDDATENAVKLFQQVNDIPGGIDGVAGQNTLQVLYSSNAKPCNI